MSERPMKLDTISLRVLHSTAVKIFVATLCAFLPYMFGVTSLGNCLALLKVFLSGLALATVIEAGLRQAKIGATLGLWDEALTLNACAILAHHIGHL